MRFRFRLASLLRLRIMREEIELERLRLAQFESRQAETALIELRERAAQTHFSFLEHGVSLTGTQLQFLQQCTSTGAKAEESVLLRFKAAGTTLDEQRIRHEKAQQESAVLQKLEDRQKERFRESEVHREQQSLDEVFALVNRRTRQHLPSE